MAVDVDYNSTISIRDQISIKVIYAIKRIHNPVLNLMRVHGMHEISSYCGNIDSISDICYIYHTASWPKYIILGNLNVPDENLKNDEEEMMKRLTNLASDFNAGNGNRKIDDIAPTNVSTIIADVMEKGKMNGEEFNCKFFLSLFLMISVIIILDICCIIWASLWIPLSRRTRCKEVFLHYKKCNL